MDAAPKNRYDDREVVWMEIFAPDMLMQLMEIAEKEALSVLICYNESGKSGFIFEHLQKPYQTILRNFGAQWDVYYQSDVSMKAENVHSFQNLQDACNKVLEYARAAKIPASRIHRRLLHWTLDEAGVLTLSGKGAMATVHVPQCHIVDAAQLAFELEYGDCSLNAGDVNKRNTLPWNGRVVKKAILASGLTSVCFSAFSTFCINLGGGFYPEKYERLEEIILPDTMETLECSCISDCPALTKVVIPASVTSIADSKFGYVLRGCPKVTIHTTAGSYAEDYAKRHAIPVMR